jgi:hypothetical protein
MAPKSIIVAHCFAPLHPHQKGQIGIARSMIIAE